MLVIHDPKVAQALEEIAGREQRPVDEVLKTMIEHYPAPPTPTSTSERSAAFRRVRTKAYARARRYWETVGDHDKLALTDDELDEQFGAFDEEGIPRLKSELTSLEPPVGSMAYAAKIARQSKLHSGRPDLALVADDLLDQYFSPKTL
jgi:hypothetical protein